MMVKRLACALGLVLSTSGPGIPTAVDAAASLPAVARSGARAVEALAAGADRAVQLAAGDQHVCALTASGAVRCWGGNAFGQLGTGTTFLSTYLPTTVRGLPPARAIAAGAYTTCAITTADDLYCWGRGELYALGNAATAVVTRPFKLLGGVKTVDQGWYHGCAALLDGGLKCWGRIAFITPLGQTRTLGSQTPEDVIQPQGSPILALTGGNQTSCALLANGAVTCWGLTGMIDYGVSGVVPPTVIGTGFAAVSGDQSHLCGLAGGGLQCLGANGYGQLGLPPSANGPQTFQSIPGLPAPTALATGTRHTCALDASHRLWCWGDNGSGQLGRGRTGPADSTPQLAVALSETVTQVAAASLSTCALTDSGKVFCWGSNTSRQTTARGYGAQVWPVRVPGFGPVTDGPVAITGIEVNQGIQNLSNDMPLVAQRRTVVRVFARSTTGAALQPVIALTGARAGAPLPGSPLAPLNAQRVTNLGGDRASLSGGYYFELPPAWLGAGTLDLEVENLSSARVCEDQTGVPADCRAAVTFETTPAAQLMIVGLPYVNASGVRVAAPSLAERRQAARQLLRAFPVPDVIWSTVDSPVASPVPLGHADDGWTSLNEVAIPLMQRRGADGCGSPCTTVYMYLLADPPKTGLPLYGVTLTGQGVGMSYTDHPAADTPGNYLLFAHEVAHGYGLNHAPCDQGDPPANLDPGFPDPAGRIDATLHGDHGFIGLDVFQRRVFAPDHARDLMAYCQPNWLSNYHAEKLLDRFQTGVNFPSLPTAAKAADVGLVAGDVLVISGALDPAGTVVVLGPAFDVPGASAPPPPAAGVTTARLLDGAQNVLADLPLTVGALSDDAQGLQAFIGLVQRPAGLARLQIMTHGVVRVERSVSAHAPTVALAPLSGPVSGTLTLSWSASDGDGDPLRYWVQMSEDAGVSWQTLATNLGQTTLDLETAALPGTAHGQFRVIASDGLLSAASTSGAVSIAGHVPQVEILAPLVGTSVQVDATLVAMAAAYDAEDGSALPDSAYVWSTGDGQVLASGRMAAIDVAQLDPDDPRLRVTVTDSTLAQATAEVTLVLEAPPTLLGLYLPLLSR